MREILRRISADPRHYQIACLAGLLAYGWSRLSFEIQSANAVLIVAAALVTQWAGDRVSGTGKQLPLGFEPRSALISALSLCLLLRTNSWELAVLGAVLAIGSKFVVRWRGKHLFNPTNVALVALLAGSGGAAWVSAGQWGSVAFFAFLMACLGGLVVTKARRADITLAFLGFHAAFLFGRAWSLGDPLRIPLHSLQSGALLLFAFFMISDPRSTPSSRTGRMIFAFLVALGTWYITFRLFRTNGLLWSLAGVSLLTPLLDRVLPGPDYGWKNPGGRSVSLPDGVLKSKAAAAPGAAGAEVCG